MSITRDALRSAAKSLAQDGPSQGQTGRGIQLLLTDPTDYNTAIDQALAQFERDRPNLRVVDCTIAASGFRFNLTGAGAILPTDPEPPAAPTLALASPAAPGNVDNGSHLYVVTSVYGYGETRASQPSAAVVVTDKSVNGQVRVSIAEPDDTTDLLSFNVYRTDAIATGGKKLAGSVAYAALATTVFVDNVADPSLTTVAPTTSTALHPDAWRAGASGVTAVWWPYDATAQGVDAIDMGTYRTRRAPGGVIELEFVSGAPAASDVVRLEFSSPHVLSETDPTRTTVLQADQKPLVAISAAMILTMAANKAVQNTGTTSLPNDVVDRRSQSDVYRSRAKDLLALYQNLVGKGDPASIKAASATLDLDVMPGWRFGGLGDFISHPRGIR